MPFTKLKRSSLAGLQPSRSECWSSAKLLAIEHLFIQRISNIPPFIGLHELNASTLAHIATDSTVD